MTAGAWTTAPRARALAGAAVAALGIHVWIATIVLPGVFVGAPGGPAATAVAALPPAALAAGLWRRSRPVLLLAFPTAVVAAITAAPALASTHAYDPIRFVAVAASLVGYLFAASALCAHQDVAAPRSRTKLSVPPSPRWRRRNRIYRGLAALSIAFPAVLLYAVHFDAQNRAYLREMYSGQVELVTTALGLLALGVWMVIFAYAFAGVLGPHRKGDLALRAELARLRDSGRDHPRLGFYLGIATAVVLTLVLLALRAR